LTRYLYLALEISNEEGIRLKPPHLLDFDNVEA